MSRPASATSMTWASLLVSVLLAAGVDPARSTTPGSGVWTQPLEPEAVVAYVDFAGRPLDLEVRRGLIHLLDPAEEAIWILDPATGRREILDLPSRGASSLFFGCGDALHVVDPLERALFVLEAGADVWRRRDLGYRVFHGAGDDQAIVFNADRRRDAHLIAGATCAGDTLRYGERMVHAHPYPSVSNNLNYARLAVSPRLVAVGHIALGRLQIFERRGPRLADIDLTGPEVVQMRGVYLANLGLEAGDQLAVERDTLIADLVRAAEPERFTVPVYVNDLAVGDGLVHVLVNNTLQIFTPAGELLARRPIAGADRGQVVVLHAICLTPEDRLYGLDTVHYRKIYDFGPAARLAAGPTRPGNEEGAAATKESDR
jgi:hypothetical protein